MLLVLGQEVYSRRIAGLFSSQAAYKEALLSTTGDHVTDFFVIGEEYFIHEGNDASNLALFLKQKKKAKIILALTGMKRLEVDENKVEISHF